MRISARGIERRREVDAVACSTLPSREAGQVNKRLIIRLIMLEKNSTITNFEDNIKCNSATLIESLRFTEK